MVDHRSFCAQWLRLGILAFAVLGMGCTVSPTTFVLEQPIRGAGFETFQVTFLPNADDPSIDPDLVNSFQKGFHDGLEDDGGFHALVGDKANGGTLIVNFRAAGLKNGSLAERAGTAAVNALLPAGIVPEIGSGDVAVKVSFFDSSGNSTGKILVQADVHGIFATEAGAVREVGKVAGEFMSKTYSNRTAPPELDQEGHLKHSDSRFINMFSQEAKAQMSIFEPLVGDWDMTLSIESPGLETHVRKVVKTGRLEADGRLFTENLQTLDDPKQYRFSFILWDPVHRTIKALSADSWSGAHASKAMSIVKDGDTIRGIARDSDVMVELVEVLSDGGNARDGTTTIWTLDGKRMIAKSTFHGTKRK